MSVGQFCWQICGDDRIQFDRTMEHWFTDCWQSKETVPMGVSLQTQKMGKKAGVGTVEGSVIEMLQAEIFNFQC